MLHSGARYVNKEIDIAKLCSQENIVIKRILPYAVGNKEGLFIVKKEYEKLFPNNQSIDRVGIRT